MHFTLWPSLTESTGGHGEITWESFLSFVSAPAVAAEKSALEGWSPARFSGNRRALAACELVSCIVLDDDKSGLPLERVRAIWSSVAGVVHSSFSHTPEAPKWRIVLRCSRDMTPHEQARVWAAIRALAAASGQTIDEATKDASRFWYVPGRREGADYEWAELAGAALPVDEILASAPSSRIMTEPILTFDQPLAPRRAAMAAALSAAWPSNGRHEAQLALAGALRGESWSEGEAVDFLTAVAGERSKREATCRHTWSRPEGAPLTGWTRLKVHVDPVIVDATRVALGRDAEWSERDARRLEDVRRPDPAAIPEPEGLFAFKTGGFDAELPPIDYQIDGYIARGDVVMIVAHGNSLKTWLAFSIAQAVASGRPWLGRFVTKQGRAAILDFESDDYEQRRRFKILGVRDDEVADRLLRSSYPAAQLVDPESWIVLAEHALDLVVVDSFNAASPGEDENDARSALLLQHAGRFANGTRCTVVVIHHARKDGGDDRLSVRGSTALFAACDRIFKSSETETNETTGAVTTTLKAIKPGAGKRPVNVRVELSDQGLRYVDAPVEVEPEEVPTPERNRELVLSILKLNSAGVAKEHLVNLMKGKREAKFELLSQLVLSGVVVEYRDSAEKKAFLMLNPGAEK